MSNKIQLVDRSLTEKAYQRGEHYHCYLDGIPVGELSKSSARNPMWGEEYSVSLYEGGHGWNEEPRLHYFKGFKTIFEAKRGMLKAAEAYVREVKMSEARQAPVAYLPSADSDFYPTPSTVSTSPLTAPKLNVPSSTVSSL